MNFDRFNKVVPRLFDVNEGEAVSALTAMRAMAFPYISSGEIHINQFVFGSPSVPSQNIMDLVNEHKKPLLTKISNLERDIKQKDRQIKELLDNGCAMVETSPASNLDAERIIALEKSLAEKNDEIERLKAAQGNLTILDLAQKGNDPKNDPVAKPTNVHSEYRERRRQAREVKTDATPFRAFYKPLLKLIREKNGRVNATDAKTLILPYLAQFDVVLTKADLTIGFYNKRPGEPLWYNTLQVTAKELKKQGILKTPSLDETATTGWWELT